jgi:sulfate transport system permease protein
MTAKWSLRLVALGYVGMLLALPVGLIVWHTFENGLAPVWDALTTQDALHALWLSVLIALIVVPANTVFGVMCALVLVRHRFPGKALLSAFVDLPLGVSPIVVGLALVIVYGRLVWSLVVRPQHPDHLRASGHGACHDLYLDAVRGTRGCPCLA